MPESSRIPVSAEVADHLIGLHDQLHGPALQRFNCPCGVSYVVICEKCESIVFVGLDTAQECEHYELMMRTRR